MKILSWLFSVTQTPYDTDKMSEEFIDQFCNRAFSEGQVVCIKMGFFRFQQIPFACKEGK